ncbi:MAG: cysteine desulfurase NifS [Chlamydiales bacterium]
MTIYLDHSSFSRPSEQAVSAMIPYFRDLWGSITSPNLISQQFIPHLNEAYHEIYQLLGGGTSDTFIFTSSGAEAVNHAIFATYLDATLETGRNQYITLPIENAPTIMSIERLEKWGCVGKTVPLDSQGYVSADQLGDVITPRTALFSMTWAHGLTGLIQPINEVSDLCKERGIRFHLDVTHALGKLYFDLEDLGAEILTFNGSQLHAPQGTGGLFFREGTQLSPWITGGLEQGGWRAGDLNIPLLIGLGVAVKEALQTRDYLCTEIARLRDFLEEEVSLVCSESVPLFKDRERLPNVSVIAFPGIASEALLYTLNHEGLSAGIGGGETQQLQHLLKASGIPSQLAQTALSFSLSRETTQEEIERAIEIISQSVKQLRTLSSHLNISGGDT